MKKPILYCDCDGVIFNTIDVAFDIMRNMGCDMHDRNQIDYYFREIIDWYEVFDKATIINNSIDKIKLLREKDIFLDIIILTKLSGNKHEEGLKREVFKSYLPDTKVITLPYKSQKTSVVSTPEDHILIDDEKRNCVNWQEHDGTAILFSQIYNDLDNDIVSDLMDVSNTHGYKKLIKARYF